MSAWEMTEEQLYGEVLALCEGRPLWPVVLKPERHNQRAASNKGFPDVMVFGPGGALFRELKSMAGMTSGHGLRTDQVTWRNRLQAGGHDWAIWTPDDLARGRINAQLRAVEQATAVSDDWSLVQLDLAPVERRPASPVPAQHPATPIVAHVGTFAEALAALLACCASVFL